MVDEFDNLKREIEELTFENEQLRKDVRESAKIIKDY